LATFLSSWIGLVMVPYFQIGRLQPEVDDLANQFPPPPSGLTQQGAKSYAANGCMYCHTQQIRPFDLGENRDRGWGTRRTVARDYIHDRPVFLGTMRTGPDLTNIGVRWGKDAAAAMKHHVHLYQPRSLVSNSIMPSFSYLYEIREIKGQPSSDALQLPEDYLKKHPEAAPAPGYEIVPTAEARQLVAYLMSLDRTYPLKEVPEK
jgi:cytochrome c oxidase cbb3-type subunit 2